MIIVADNTKNNTMMINHIKSWLNSKQVLLHKGAFFHTQCTVHIINLIVKNGLKMVVPLLDSIRKSCLYIGSLLSREQKWKVVLSQTMLKTIKKIVKLDVETKWDSTYLMLEKCIISSRGF